MALTYDNLKQEFRLTDSGDSWGSVMAWWFAVADEIYFGRDFEVPGEWRFRPSPLGSQNDPEMYETECVREASDEALQRFGAVLTRYASMLRAAGKDY